MDLAFINYSTIKVLVICMQSGVVEIVRKSHRGP